LYICFSEFITLLISVIFFIFVYVLLLKQDINKNKKNNRD
jgi:hypothetical protein